MKLVTSSTTGSWLNLDSWSETYIGARWLIVNVLPEKRYESSPEHGPLSQMVLLASHHMIEVMFFSCVKKHLKKLSLPKNELEEQLHKLEKMRFHEAFTKLKKLIPSMDSFEYDSEPYTSINRLRLRRNATIHKDSALTSLIMARSALYTAVTGSKEIFAHFNNDTPFKYKKVLDKYPLDTFPLFSEVIYPEDYGKVGKT